MQINSLKLKNIGPFLDADLDFIGSNSKPSVVFITGINGTGKTIILDAIRKLLLGNYCSHIPERDICRNDDFWLEMDLDNFFYKNLILSSGTRNNDLNNSLNLVYQPYDDNFIADRINNFPPYFINYWTSKTDNEPYKINSLEFFNPTRYSYLKDGLNGIQKNAEVIELITYFDYLKDSENPKERKEGEFLFKTLKKIINASLLHGEFKNVERKILMPIVSQNGSEVSFDKLSSGNQYIIQRMIAMLGQMYAVYSLNNIALEDMLNTPGVLLIDEVENHLHPQWQKTFINTILEFFPNLQIIATTHSPFIVGSVENAKVFVCESKGDHSEINEMTEEFSNKPIDEILISDAFSITQVFANNKILELMEQRKNAILNNDKENEEVIEKQLLSINPNYFGYLEIDKLMAELKSH